MEKLNSSVPPCASS